ncbi:MAG: hypothetical protein RBU21_01090 [FCB group bacterium]|jgi:hypothetical protein|nr:hypothetical protein [FCB group bacterium]
MTLNAGYDLSTGVRAYVRDWPQVKEGKKFGCASFQCGRRLFAFCEEDAVVLTLLGTMQREKAVRLYGATAHVRNGKERPDWCRIPCRSRLELQALEGIIRESYEAALFA